MICTIDLSQSFVFAQNTTSITPAPKLSGSNDDDSLSNEDNDSDNDENNESTGSSGSGDNDGDDSDSDTISSDEEDDKEDNAEQTNPLLEEIRNRVNGALSASGMPGPIF